MSDQQMDSAFAQKLAEHQKQRLSNDIGTYIHDIVYGGVDGIVTTFAVVSGAIGAGFDIKVIIVLGIANLIGDGTSMGLGSYLSVKSEIDHYKREEKQEYEEIKTMPEIETAEVREIYRKKGFTGSLLDQVVKVITSDDKRWVDTMMREELELQYDPEDKPWLHGLSTFGSFCLFGFIPLIPFVFGIDHDIQFTSSIIGTLAALIALASLRFLITKERGFRGIIEITFVGTVCAAIAYGIGTGLDKMLG